MEEQGMLFGLLPTNYKTAQAKARIDALIEQQWYLDLRRIVQ